MEIITWNKKCFKNLLRFVTNSIKDKYFKKIF